MHPRQAARNGACCSAISILASLFFYTLDCIGNRTSISEINVRNQFRGIIKEIIRGSVVSEVDVETANGIVTSVITTRSIADLELKVGSEVIALVKATDVSLAKIA